MSSPIGSVGSAVWDPFCSEEAPEPKGNGVSVPQSDLSTADNWPFGQLLNDNASPPSLPDIEEFSPEKGNDLPKAPVPKLKLVTARGQLWNSAQGGSALASYPSLTQSPGSAFGHYQIRQVPESQPISGDSQIEQVPESQSNSKRKPRRNLKSRVTPVSQGKLEKKAKVSSSEARVRNQEIRAALDEAILRIHNFVQTKSLENWNGLCSVLESDIAKSRLRELQ